MLTSIHQWDLPHRIKNMEQIKEISSHNEQLANEKIQELSKKGMEMAQEALNQGYEKLRERYQIKSFGEMMHSVHTIIPPIVLYMSSMRKPTINQVGATLGLPVEQIDLLVVLSFYLLVPFALGFSFLTEYQTNLQTRVNEFRGKVSVIAMALFRSIVCGLACLSYELGLGDVPTDINYLRGYLKYMIVGVFALITIYEWFDARLDQFLAKMQKKIK